MDKFTCTVEVRWADLDPNFHLRHSVYYDYGAYCRIQFLSSKGITAQFMHQHQFGPIIFREECLFKREIRLEDKVSVDVCLIKGNRDFSRWSMEHQIFKNNETLSAVITLDGAWIDVQKRKLTVPPAEVIKTFENAPRSERFQWIEK